MESVLGFHAISVSIPLHTEIVSIPVVTVGVTITVYPVELTHEKLLATPLVIVISLRVNPLAHSVVVREREIGHEIIAGAREVREIPGLVVSSVLTSVIPDATNWVAIPPVYTIPLVEMIH